jgi:pilus assembly protein FimV
MPINVASKIITLAIGAFVAAAIASCGSVTSSPDGGTAGTHAGGTAGAAGTGSGAAGTTGAAGTSGSAGTTGAAGMGGGGAGGRTGTGGMAGLGGAGGGPLTCRTDVAGDCPNGFTCACGGPGPVGAANCTCHRNCSDNTVCPVAEPMCGCPSSVGGPRFCVNACFCSCQ